MKSNFMYLFYPKGGAENELPFSSNDLNRLLQNAVIPSVQPGQHRYVSCLPLT